jgi:biotin carboxyl carrier protein
VEADIEIACDADAMRGADPSARKQYAFTILSFAQGAQPLPSPLTTQFYGGKKQMLARFSDIISRNKKKSGILFAIFFGLLIALGGAFTGDNVLAAGEKTSRLSTVSTFEGTEDEDIRLEVNYKDTNDENLINAAILITPKSESIDSCVVTVGRGRINGEKQLTFQKNDFPIEVAYEYQIDYSQLSDSFYADEVTVDLIASGKDTITKTVGFAPVYRESRDNGEALIPNVFGSGAPDNAPSYGYGSSSAVAEPTVPGNENIDIPEYRDPPGSKAPDLTFEEILEAADNAANQEQEVEQVYQAITDLTAYEGTFSGRLAWPVPDYYEITSEYGWRFEGADYHTGMDIAASHGVPVTAAADGVVMLASTDYTPSIGYGIYVMLDHGDAISTIYGNLSDILVTAGDTVEQGQIIAEAGSTGFSTEPHLHFEMRDNGMHLDPAAYLMPSNAEAEAEANDSADPVS